MLQLRIYNQELVIDCNQTNFEPITATGRLVKKINRESDFDPGLGPRTVCPEDRYFLFVRSHK